MQPKDNFGLFHFHSRNEFGKYQQGINHFVLAPGKFERNFSYVTFKQILVIDGWGIACEIALILMSLDFTDDQLTLVHIGSGNGLVPSGNKPLPEPMLT